MRVGLGRRRCLPRAGNVQRNPFGGNPGAGSRSQIAQARKIVTDARRALHRLLAEETPEE